MAKKNTVKKPTAKKSPAKVVKEVAPVVEETQEATTTDEETQTPEEKATTPTAEKSTAKVKKGQIMEVVVTAKKFGTYKKGDVIKMHESTAQACMKSGVVEAK